MGASWDISLCVEASMWLHHSINVMAGLVVPAIHVFLCSRTQDVDARDKPGHDERATATHPTAPTSNTSPS
jgi:hypothetical protein